MTGHTVNGSGKGARSGAQTLVMLAAPLNVLILRGLAPEPKQLTDLQRETGAPALTTLRTQLKRLRQIGVIEKRPCNRFPGTLEYELNTSGRELLAVAAALDRWLSRAPEGSLSLGGSAAKAAVKAFAEGWSATILRALAATPLSLTDLDRLIGALSYPALERRLGAMRLAGQIEARPGRSRSTPYAVTDWLREAVAPLVAASRWEQRHRGGESTPVGCLDVETALLLVSPLLSLPEELSGACRLAVEVADGKPSLAGAMLGVTEGRVVSCSTNLQGDADAWAVGSVSAWLDATLDGGTSGLEIGGDCNLAAALIDAMRRSDLPQDDCANPIRLENELGIKG